MHKLINLMPEWLKETLRQLRNLILSLLYIGNKRYCPVCNKTSRKFRTYGETSREDSVCVHCSSLERHRLVWLFFTKMTDLLNQKSKTFLHIAPERCFVPRLRKILKNGHYITADLYDERASVKMDITDIKFDNSSIDAVYCSHVLEHVQDDRKALAEFYRILKPGGWAVFMVPIELEKAFEDPGITDAAERKKMFGQEDHVRIYGRDFIERVCGAGFNVTVSNAKDICSEEEIKYMSLLENEEIFFCKKL